MEKRIELERRGRPVEEIVELNLDNCRATQQISGLTDEFVKLEVLSLINVGLTTLKGFPALPNLKKLELSDNRISSGLNILHSCPKLSYINLSGNKIKDIETLEPLKDLAELRNLDLFNCEVTNAENYREAIFGMLSKLEYLDGFDRNNQEAEEDEDDDDDDDDESLDDNDDEDDVDKDDDDDDDEDDEDEGQVGGGLDESGVLDDEDDDDDDDDEDDEEDSEEEGEEVEEEVDGDSAKRGTKRKHTEEEEEDDDDGDEEDDE